MLVFEMSPPTPSPPSCPIPQDTHLWAPIPSSRQKLHHLSFVPMRLHLVKQHSNNLPCKAPPSLCRERCRLVWSYDVPNAILYAQFIKAHTIKFKCQVSGVITPDHKPPRLHGFRRVMNRTSLAGDLRWKAQDSGHSGLHGVW